MLRRCRARFAQQPRQEAERASVEDEEDGHPVGVLAVPEPLDGGFQPGVGRGQILELVQDDRQRPAPPGLSVDELERLAPVAERERRRCRQHTAALAGERFELEWPRLRPS